MRRRRHNQNISFKWCVELRLHVIIIRQRISTRFIAVLSAVELLLLPLLTAPPPLVLHCMPASQPLTTHGYSVICKTEEEVNFKLHICYVICIHYSRLPLEFTVDETNIYNDGGRKTGNNNDTIC